MNQAVYDKLVAVARARQLISYSDLGSAADLEVSDATQLAQLGRILDEIALHEVRAGRPLLAILVIRADLKMPSKGLFTFAKKHGLMKGQDDVSFFSAELKRVYGEWAV